MASKLDLLSAALISPSTGSRPLLSPSSGKLLQWPRYFSKQSGCEMAEICTLPSLPPFPPLLSVSSVYVPLCTTRGRNMEFFVTVFNLWKKELRASSLHVFGRFQDTTQHRQDVLWETPPLLCSHTPALGLTLFDKVHVCLWHRDSRTCGWMIDWLIWKVCPDGSLSLGSNCIQGLKHMRSDR